LLIVMCHLLSMLADLRADSSPRLFKN